MNTKNEKPRETFSANKMMKKIIKHGIIVIALTFLYFCYHILIAMNEFHMRRKKKHLARKMLELR